jgi:hypothetical protein
MSYSVKDYEDQEGSVSIILTVKDAFGSLADTLEVFQVSWQPLFEHFYVLKMNFIEDVLFFWETITSFKTLAT